MAVSHLHPDKQRLVAHVSLVYLPVSLTAPAPSGSAEPARLCRGCSHPSRRPPGRAASSFIPPLRRRNNGWSFTSIRNTSASWRSYDRPTAPWPARTLAGFTRSARVRPGPGRAPSVPRGRRCPHGPGKSLAAACRIPAACPCHPGNTTQPGM